MLAFVTILSSNRSSFLRGYQPARFPSPPPLPLISLKKWSVLIYQSPLQTWTRRYSIIERTGHGDLDVSNGLISSFQGPSSLRGSHRKGKREAGGNKGKEEVQDFLWTLLIVLSPYKMIPFLILTGTKSPTQSTPALNTHGHEIKSSTSGGKVSSAQTRASQKQSTGNNAPQRKVENEEEESNSVKRIALFAVTAILAGGLLLCILVLLFLFIWRRHLR